jgi:hypothetical protein
MAYRPETNLNSGSKAVVFETFVREQRRYFRSIFWGKPEQSLPHQASPCSCGACDFNGSNYRGFIRVLAYKQLDEQL